MDRKQKGLALLGQYLSEEQVLSPEAVSICLDAINLSLAWKPRFASTEELETVDAFVSYSFGIGRRKDGGVDEEDPFKILYVFLRMSPN